MPDVNEFEPVQLPVRAVRQRVYGDLYVTEHPNYGDVQFESAIEPAETTHKVAIGEAVKVKAATRVVVLFATYRCRVAFIPDGEEMANAISHAWPLAPDTEVQRVAHINTPMTIVSFPDY
jgi:hypothetical protein